MANPISITYAANTSGAQTAIALDWRISPFSVSYDVIKTTGGGTLSVTIETTLDNVNDASITPVWSDLGSALTATTRGSLTAPVQFIRVNFGTLTGTTCTFKLLQGDLIN